MTPDVNIIVTDFQNTKNREMVTENQDGSYTIFINAKFSHETQLEAYRHAMKHIENEDFEKSDVQIIETIAHKADAPIQKENPSDFQKRILDELRCSKKRIEKERKRIKERNDWLKENAPDIYEKMKMKAFERLTYEDIESMQLEVFI